MTYTFKLARRLAVSRDLVVLSALILLAACNDESTAPDTGSSQIPSAAIQISPRSVVIETHQRVQLRGHMRTWRGDLVSIPLVWDANGGQVSSEGVFLSSTAGTFKVTGRGRGRSDTSVVKVVPKAKDLVRIAVTPDPAKVDAGATQTFTAIGYLKDGSTTSVGVYWSATGGVIDPAGLYTANSTGGTFRVVATNTDATLADTSAVTITQPAATLASVIVSPTSTSLISGDSKQFKAYGRNSDGDSLAVTASFTATGGTISSTGLYTAGPTSGTYRVIASSSGKADTAAVIVTSSDTVGGAVGISFGPYNLWSGSSTKSYVGPFGVSINSASPSGIVTQISAARAKGQRLIPVLMGPAADYVTNGAFDLGKWKARYDQFNTSAIRAAIADGVKDGTVVGLKLIDEPEHKKWGTGLSKAVLDEMAAYSKKYFPTAPTGISVGPPGYRWHTTETFKVLDWVLYQYDYWVTSGDVPKWRDAVLAQAKVDGVAPAFSLNILDGGVPDKDGTWDCAGNGQADKGTYDLRCGMTPDQVKTWGRQLAASGCMLLMWRYDDVYMGKSENREAFADVARALAGLTPKSCRRTG